jgi:hypothetical protein
MESKQQKRVFWDVRVVLFYKENKMIFNVHVYGYTKKQAEDMALDWVKTHVVAKVEAIGKYIGRATDIDGARAQASRAPYIALR